MKHYIFDFDGTLVDSMPYWSEKMLNILRKNNIEYPSDIIKTIATLGDMGTAKYFIEEFKINLSMEEMLEQMDGFAFPKYRDVIDLKSGVLEYLNLLKSKGCSLNILTASPHKMVDVCLKRIGIFELFDNVWTCEDFGMAKTDVCIYVKSAEKLGTNVSNIAFFDDNLEALKTASNAGFYTVGVYDESAASFTNEIKLASNKYIESFECLEQL